MILLVLIWALFGAGVIANVANLRTAARMYRTVRRSRQNGLRLVQAVRGVRAPSVRLLVQIAILSVAVLRLRGGTWPNGLSAIHFVIWCSVSVDALWDWHDRDALRWLLEGAQDRERPGA